MHDIIKASIFAAIGVLVFASLLVPVVSDAMIENGTPVTYTNADNSGSGYHYDKVDSITLVIDSEGAKINGVLIERAAVPIVLMESDNVSINLPGADSSATMEFYYNNSTTGGQAYGGTLDLTAENGTITAIAGSNTLEFTYTWIVSIVEDGKYINHQSNGQPKYYTDPNEVIVCGGIYSTGDNDTYYSWYNGVGTDNGNYQISFNPNGQKVAGTTDVYSTANPRVVVGDETFTPYRMLIIETVNGHEASGALYDMLGVLPIAVICVLIFGVLGAALYSRIE